jgi:capsid protein
MENEKPKFITLENKSGVHTPADAAVWNSALTGQGVTKLTPELIKDLSVAADATVDKFAKTIAGLITKQKAEFIRKLRVEQDYTWRAVAQACYDEWKGNWTPPSNQIMGMMLCEVAASFFNEDYMSDPWN